jgi:predicted nucleic acid-binding protein
MKWLLDTNIIIHALNGVPAVRRRLNEAEERGEILTSAVVVGELIYGAGARLGVKRTARTSGRSWIALASCRLMPGWRTGGAR